MNSRNKLILLVSIIIILVFASVISWSLFGSKSVTITKYIEDNNSWTVSFSDYCSQLSVSLTATTDAMNVRIIVDGNTVYDQSNTWTVNFNHNMGFGEHAIHIYMENPSVFGLGRTILVSGKATISLL